MRKPNPSSPLEKAIRFLAVRPRSTAEVRTRLARYDLDTTTIESVITHLTETKLLDDLSFARWWVQSRGTSRSGKALRYELARKKISKEIIAEVIKDQDDLAALQTLLAKRLQRSKVGLPEDRDKLIRFAIARGYSYEDIKTVLRNLSTEC